MQTLNADSELQQIGTSYRTAAAPAETEISLLDVATVLLQHKRPILGATLAAGLVSAVVAWLLPVSFTAEAIILPPQQQQSSLSALASGALGGLAGSGMAAQLGLKNPGDLYIGILGSRTIADHLIGRFRLETVYKTRLASDARKALTKHASFSSGKDSLIKIDVTDHDPRRAADLANGFVDELYEQNSRLAISDAAQRRVFFEAQLEKEKNALADAEIALKDTQQATGLVAPSGQAEVLIRSGAQLRAEIASREVQLQATRSYATDQNPQVQVLTKEITALQAQLGQLESSGSGNSKMEVSAGKLPSASLAYIRKLRDMKYHETLFELLSKQYEAARIDEAKQAPVIQVIDRAVVPDRKSWPPRALIVGGAMAATLILAAVWVIAGSAFRNLSQAPDHAEQLRCLSNALRF